MARFTLQHIDLARRVHRVGQIRQDLGGAEPVENFPYALTMMTITRMVIRALRLGYINAACNKFESVEAAVDLLFAAATHHLVVQWEEKGLCVDDFSAVTQALEAECMANPKGLIRQFRKSHLWDPAAGPGDLEVVAVLNRGEVNSEGGSERETESDSADSTRAAVRARV